ncbi:MAG: fibronectin type III domain-containing protein [Verrucomicrobiota bacterium]|nr:fibronectin type III domain-containing protein [Verrucomicrobiota bacterium]
MQTTVAKVKLSELNRLQPGGLYDATGVALEAMAKFKVDYPDPVPSLGVVSSARNSLGTAMMDGDVAGGGKIYTTAIKARATELLALVRQLANYVTLTANGDYEKLVKAGLPVQKPTRGPVGPLNAPRPPRVTQGKLSGELLAATKAVYGAQTYNWRVALESAPTDYVRTLQTTSSRISVGGLTPGLIYRVQVNAVGAAGASEWSDDGALMVI